MEHANDATAGWAIEGGALLLDNHVFCFPVVFPFSFFIIAFPNILFADTLSYTLLSQPLSNDGYVAFTACFLYLVACVFLFFGTVCRW